ncbi:MAG TPA: exonuclease domain-containing protein [Thermomicrobiales bacterium]|nr:exonuclease domain-containing protein [Thermomicrobiales bacterium]
MMHEDSPQEEGRYGTLCDRALEFVLSKGGIVHEDRLIAYVFGNTGMADLWRPLLRTTLGTDDRLVFHANGEWSIPSLAAVNRVDGELLDEFVALDVETTGLKPNRQRIIEIAAVRYRHGQVERSFETFLNPERGIPEFITRLTTITNEHVREAPTFAQVASEVVEFIGDSLIVGHNVRFDISFMNAELQRVDLPPLINERLDTMGLSVRLLKSLRKPSLDRVAAAVGLSPRKIHRAGDDARLTAEVALRLVGEAARQGVTTIDQLKSAATVVTPRPRDDVGRARSVLDRSMAHAMPRKPGCYLMRSERGEIIYVGKAKNLRDRVSSYYSQPIGYTRKMDGLIESVTRIDHEVVGSELEALLLESQLIHRYMPRYNTALKRTEHYPYIKVDIANPWPRVQLARLKKDDGARYFGPYRNASSARKTVDVVNSVLPLRTCTRSFKSARSYGKPCIALDLGTCLGPCTGQADRDEYQRIVHEVLSFLEGKGDALHALLLGELEKAAERLDFERAERLRKDIRSVTTILDEQARLHEAERMHNLLLVLPSADPECREVMIVLKGRRWSQIRATRVPAWERGDSLVDDEDGIIAEVPAGGAGDIALHELATRLDDSLGRARNAVEAELDPYAIDEASILNRWLFRNAGHPAMISLPMTDDDVVAGNPLLLARKALSLTDDVLATFDIRKASGDDAEEGEDERRHVPIEADVDEAMVGE